MARTTSVNHMLRADGEGEGVLDGQFIYAHYARWNAVQYHGYIYRLLPPTIFPFPFLAFPNLPIPD